MFVAPSEPCKKNKLQLIKIKITREGNEVLRAQHGIQRTSITLQISNNNDNNNNDLLVIYPQSGSSLTKLYKL
jgi:hypothetical protein